MITIRDNKIDVKFGSRGVGSIVITTGYKRNTVSLQEVNLKANLKIDDDVTEANINKSSEINLIFYDPASIDVLIHHLEKVKEKIISENIFTEAC